MKAKKMYKKIRSKKHWKINWWYDADEETLLSKWRFKVNVNDNGDVESIFMSEKGKKGGVQLPTLPAYPPKVVPRPETKTMNIKYPHYIKDDEVFYLDLYFSFNRRSTSFFITIDHFKNKDKIENSTFNLSLIPDPWTSHGRGGGGN